MAATPRTQPMAPARLPAPLVVAIRRHLLSWYDVHRRDLPWRRRTDAYTQWVAEVMLQQTRVETVIGYYERFLARFPTISALAEADHDDVLKRWEGLGYYRRILNLHRAAQQVVAEGGVIPATAEELRRLPGVGAYTSAAIASIAFGERAAAVDGNVARVVARLFGVTEDILAPAGKAEIQRLADQLTPSGRPGDFNQAWMDLGSAVCTPRNPRCGHCPLREHCTAAATGRTEALPVRGGRVSITCVACITLVAIHGECVLIRKRPAGGLWSGLHEFPTLHLGVEQSQADGLRELRAASGLPARRERPRRIGIVEHRLTHRLMSFSVHVLRVAGAGGPPAERYSWASRAQLDALAFSTAHRRILALVEADGVLGPLAGPPNR